MENDIEVDRSPCHEETNLLQQDDMAERNQPSVELSSISNNIFCSRCGFYLLPMLFTVLITGVGWWMIAVAYLCSRPVEIYIWTITILSTLELAWLGIGIFFPLPFETERMHGGNVIFITMFLRFWSCLFYLVFFIWGIIIMIIRPEDFCTNTPYIMIFFVTLSILTSLVNIITLFGVLSILR